MDFTEGGLRLKISGEPFLTEGDIVNLSIGDRHVNARVIWVAINNESKDLTDSCCAGLKVVD